MHTVVNSFIATNTTEMVTRSSAVLLSVAAALFLVCRHKVNGNCPVYGCSPSHSFTTETAIFSFTPNFKPQLQWRFEHDELMPTGAGCVTNAARVVCPMRRNNGTTALVSWDTVDDGNTSWSASLRKNVTLPIVDISGALIASDGSHLVGYTSDGTPFGKAIRLFPINGQVFDLTVALGELVVMLYKCGFLPVYFTNGIPHASIWLNDTVDGIEGTFIPLDNPAVTNHGRMYILTVFRPFDSSTKYSPSINPYVRLYAIDIRETIVERIKVVWHHDVKFTGASIPYVTSESTFCTTVPPNNKQKKSTKYLSENAIEPVGGVLVDNNTVVAVFNHYRNTICTKSSTGKSCVSQDDVVQSQLIAVEDKDESYSLLYTKELPYQFESMAYLSAQNKPADIKPFRNIMDTGTFWVSMYNSEKMTSILLKVIMSTGEIAMEFDVKKLLGASDAKVTTKLSIISKHNPKADRNIIPMVLGVTSSSEAKNCVIAVDIASEQADHVDELRSLWSLSVSHKTIGQISTVDGAQVSSLVITDDLGMSVHKLADTP